MKKYINFFVAAIGVLTVASCAKEELVDSSANGLSSSTITVGFDETKTSISNEGKTLFAEGDTLWISNGTDVRKVGVPAEYYGSSKFSFSCDLGGTLYLVYPYSAAAGVSEGKVGINVGVSQDGSFGNANIACGVSPAVESGNRTAVTLRNVTAIMKVTVSDTNPVQSLTISGNGGAISGLCAVDLSGTAPVVTAMSTSDVVNIEIGGMGGLQYIGVIPNTYPAGFSLSAVSNELSVETKTTVSAKTLAANDIVDLGTVGDNMKALEGDGSEGAPYLIHNVAEWTAFSLYVNERHDMEDQYVSLVNDISGVTSTVGGYPYDSSEGKYVDVYFKGNFDGNGHTVTVNLDGNRNVALFGDVSYPADIRNVTVAGSVKAKGEYAAGLVAMLNAGSGVSITDCHNTATVTGTKYVGGISGYADGIVAYENCSNSGAVTASSHYCAGIAGQTQYATLDNCTNSGNITNTGGQCTGGIVGRADIANVYGYSFSCNECSNSGTITVSEKYAGGILGYSAQNSKDTNKNSLSIVNCTNSGTITGKIPESAYVIIGSTNYEKRAYWGGIAGYVSSYSAYSTLAIKDCTNNGTIEGKNAGGYFAGVVGYIQNDSAAENVFLCSGCSNTADVQGPEESMPDYKELPVNQLYVGGIIGYPGRIVIKECTNKGDVIASAVEKVGGINSTNRNSHMYDCVNEGAVSGYSYVGGITGFQNWSNVYRSINKGSVTAASKFAGGIVGSNQKSSQIYSCGNEGSVTSSTYVGGVAGQMNAEGGETVWSCYNNGDVSYTLSTSDAPYAGGIIGCHTGSASDNIGNVYNSGKVHCTTATTTGSDATGAIAGTLGTSVETSELYFLNGTYDKVSGNDVDKKNTLVVMSDGTFKDGATASVDGTDYSTITDALNAWVDWKANKELLYFQVTDGKAKFTTKYGE